MKSKLSRRDAALLRLEVLVILGVLALLVAVVLPALAGGKPRSDVAVCANHLRQLGAAVLTYSMEQEGVFPPRGPTNRWPQQLLRYYGSMDVLRCPSDVAPATFGSPGPASSADWAPRSYIMNGWDDYLNTVGSSPSPGLPESTITHPGETILFGEKTSYSGHYWMDYWQGDDNLEVEQSRHGQRSGATGGGSNHAMTDGSVRMLRFGEGFAPTNMWLILDRYRNGL